MHSFIRVFLHASALNAGEFTLIVRPSSSISLVVGGPQRLVNLALKHLHGAIRPVRNDDPGLEVRFDDKRLEVSSCAQPAWQRSEARMHGCL